MATNILERIQNGDILLSDGAMGTELQKRGLPGGACPEAFNVEHPEIVQSIYRDYYQAGSDIVETNTFGGNRARLKLHGLENRVTEFNRTAAELAREVCPAGKYVAGSIGPTGEILEPLGTLSVAQAYDYFAEQAEALAAGGVDIIYVETMMSIEEIITAVKAAKQTTNLPLVASMTFDLTDQGPRTSWGVTPAMMVEQLPAAGADVLGANCGNGVDVVAAAIRELHRLTDLPLLAQPNAGLPEINGRTIIYRETPTDMAQKMEELLRMGVAILGGCCGTNPQHIRELRRLIEKRKF